MFNKSSLFAIAAIGFSAVLAAPAITKRVDHDVSRGDWQSSGLGESYWKWKTRYASLNCASQKDSPFYAECCYPLGTGESLSARPAECTPATTTCSPQTTTPVVVETPPVVNETPAPPPVTENYDSLPYCDELGEDEEPEVVTPPTTNNNQANTDTGNTNTNTDTNTTENNNNTTDNTNTNTNTDSTVNTGGYATWYEQEGNAGACGDFHNDYEMIVAIDKVRYGSDFSVKSSECGRRVRITNVNNGRTVDAVIADVCPTCVGDGNSIDLSLGVFQVLDDNYLVTGMFPITWQYLS